MSSNEIENKKKRKNKTIKDKLTDDISVKIKNWLSNILSRMFSWLWTFILSSLLICYAIKYSKTPLKGLDPNLVPYTNVSTSINNKDEDNEFGIGKLLSMDEWSFPYKNFLTETEVKNDLWPYITLIPYLTGVGATSWAYSRLALQMFLQFIGDTLPGGKFKNMEEGTKKGFENFLFLFGSLIFYISWLFIFPVSVGTGCIGVFNEIFKKTIGMAGYVLLFFYPPVLGCVSIALYIICALTWPMGLMFMNLIAHYITYLGFWFAGLFTEFKNIKNLILSKKNIIFFVFIYVVISQAFSDMGYEFGIGTMLVSFFVVRHRLKTHMNIDIDNVLKNTVKND